MILASTPESTPGGAPDPDLVSPGTIGFLVTFAVVIGVIFLIRDALRRVRRVRARSGASDAYPIPLRRHVVPNQSTLSGPDEPDEASVPADSTDTAISKTERGEGSADRGDGRPADGSQPPEERA